MGEVPLFVLLVLLASRADVSRVLGLVSVPVHYRSRGPCGWNVVRSPTRQCDRFSRFLLCESSTLFREACRSRSRAACGCYRVVYPLGSGYVRYSVHWLSRVGVLCRAARRVPSNLRSVYARGWLSGCGGRPYLYGLSYSPSFHLQVGVAHFWGVISGQLRDGPGRSRCGVVRSVRGVIPLYTVPSSIHGPR